MLTKLQWLAYLDRLYEACQANYENLFLKEGALYKGIEGHKRLAREIGPALRDFNDAERKEIIQTSYGSLHVRLCHLRPTLNVKEWIREMLKGMERHY